MRVLTAAAARIRTIAAALLSWLAPRTAREIVEELDAIDAESAREHDETGEWTVPVPPPSLPLDTQRSAA